MPNLSDFCFMFASECNEMGVLIQSRHIRSAFSRPERLHSVLSRSQGEKFTPCFLHSQSTRNLCSSKWKQIFAWSKSPGDSFYDVPICLPSVSEQTYICPNDLRERVEEDACRLLFIYKREKKSFKNLTVCMWCGLSSCLNELLSYSNRVVCTIDLCDSEKTQVQKPCQAEELTAQPLPSWEDIHLAQKISLLLMQTDDRLPAEQRVRDSG